MLKREPLVKSAARPLKVQVSALKSYSFLVKLAGGLLSIACLSGVLLYLNPTNSQKNNLSDRSSSENLSLADSAVGSLGEQSPKQQFSSLQELIDPQNSAPSIQASPLDPYRARFLLAISSLEQNKPQVALEHLNELDQEYPQLAPYILYRQAQAYLKLKQKNTAVEVGHKLIAQYPDSPVIPEIIELFESKNQKNLTYLIDNFPYHPKTQNLAKQNLAKNPQDWRSLLMVATYNRHEQVDELRDRLVLEYSDKLTQQDWQALADGYWHSGDHRKAADAYIFSKNSSPQNLYRTARGFHKNGNFAKAILAYQRLIREYHDAQETGLALVYLSRLTHPDKAIAYLNKAIAKFPQQKPIALLRKAKIYEDFDKFREAEKARSEVLNNHADSPANLNYCWRQARKSAFEGNYDSAWEWGKVIAQSKSDQSDPKAMFWVGKWAKKAGKTAAADQTFKNVLALHPQSYYAWRSAVMLGLEVGDFKNLRDFKPKLEFKSNYQPLPVGSETLQELYLLGQDQDALIQLQSELSNPQQLSVKEQFTEGLLLVKLGQNRSGIQAIWSLAQRENSQEREQWRSLRKQKSYWYSLFPFPYQNSILSKSERVDLNPLLTISVMRKESTFDPEIDSRVGALGLMQVLPRTASWIAKQIETEDYDLTKPEDNIRMGSWYLTHNHKRYEDNSLYAIASYNAGTGNVSQWLNRFDREDPDQFVEQIPFKETKDYVEGVFGNYWNYLRLYSPDAPEF